MTVTTFVPRAKYDIEEIRSMKNNNLLKPMTTDAGITELPKDFWKEAKLAPAVGNKPNIIYRVENPDNNQGLWYTGNGKYNGFIKVFGDALCHDTPMDFDPNMKDGGDWFSACDNLADMSNWFNLKDLKRLHSIGYDLYMFDVSQVRKVNGHVVFRREDVYYKEKASMRFISKWWGNS